MILLVVTRNARGSSGWQANTWLYLWVGVGEGAGPHRVNMKLNNTVLHERSISFLNHWVGNKKAFQLQTQGFRLRAWYKLEGLSYNPHPLQWPRWRLKSPASRLFTQSCIQAQIKENIKAPRHWPLCGEFTGTGECPAQRASNAENVSIWWRHHACRSLHLSFEIAIVLQSNPFAFANGCHWMWKAAVSFVKVCNHTHINLVIYLDSVSSLKRTYKNRLTHCGPRTPYGSEILFTISSGNN